MWDLLSFSLVKLLEVHQTCTILGPPHVLVTALFLEEKLIEFSVTLWKWLIAEYTLVPFVMTMKIVVLLTSLSVLLVRKSNNAELAKISHQMCRLIFMS